MTIALNPSELAESLRKELGEGILSEGEYLMVVPSQLLKVAEYLKDTAGLDFDYFDMITASDYVGRFEIIYRLLSIKNNTLVSLKTRCDRNVPMLPSMANLWKGADQQEREIFDLFGIAFFGHPDLRRIVLWEGYEGHPLRKDFKDKLYGAGD
jgi:NADH-quinone oxidoreductase subunit C